MKVLIIGGAGFIGPHFSERLLALGYQVGIFDKLSSGSEENLSETIGMEFVGGDCMNRRDAVDSVRGKLTLYGYI